MSFRTVFLDFQDVTFLQENRHFGVTVNPPSKTSQKQQQTNTMTKKNIAMLVKQDEKKEEKDTTMTSLPYRDFVVCTAAVYTPMIKPRFRPRLPWWPHHMNIP